MGKGLQSPMPHHTGRRARIMRRPINRARLLLHHPPRPLGQATHRIKIQRSKVGVACAHEWPPFLRRRCRHQLIGKAERIIVIAHEIERLR